uniref:Capsid protein n=1 Tax=Parvoviridae sp. TaxID=1940570 RepID=A0A7D3QJ03_9VIRU|nr:MAG: capsid protein [Parvoviridae sp.]
MPTKTYSNVYQFYITNNPYNYPTPDSNTVDAGSEVNTGWHVLPNQLNQHFLTQGQWADLINSSSTYTVQSISMDVFNMIPLIENLAIAGTTTFWSFNNCVYGWGYSDEYHETPYFNWMKINWSASHPLNDPNTSPNLLYKEGRQCPLGTQWKQQVPPIYSYKYPLYRISSNSTWSNTNDAGSGKGVYPGLYNTKTIVPKAAIWDPLNNAEALKEIRPGKNNLHFEHTFTNPPTFNSDLFATMSPYAATGPYEGNQRPYTYQQTLEDDPDQLCSRFEDDTTYNDYTRPNFANSPLVPSGWWWKEIQQSICDSPSIKKPNVFWPGTEREMCSEPPPQWFMKLVPLWKADSLGGNPNIIPCVAQVSCKTTIVFKYTERKSAIFTPTWGPWSWYDLYSVQPWYRNFTLAGVRSRTAGMRRTWQNIEFTAATQEPQFGSAAGHKREDPYKESSTIGPGTGCGGTYTLTTTISTASKQPDLQSTSTTIPIPKTSFYKHTLKRGIDNPTYEDEPM